MRAGVWSAILAAAILLAGMGGAVADRQDRAAAASREALAHLMDAYYRNPDFDQVLAFLTIADLDAFLVGGQEGGGPASGTQRLAILTTFLAHLVRDREDGPTRLADTMIGIGSPAAGLIGAVSIAQSGHPRRERTLTRIARSRLVPAPLMVSIRRLPEFPFPQMAAVTHHEINLFWVSFDATGDPIYLRRIVETLDSYDAGLLEGAPMAVYVGDDLYPLLLQEGFMIEAITALAAHNSLSARARANLAVRNHLTEMARTGRGPAYERLTALLDGL